MLSCQLSINRRDYLKSLQAPSTRFLTGALKLNTGTIIQIHSRRRFRFITGAHLDLLQAPISIYYRRPSQFNTGAHLDLIQAPITIPPMRHHDSPQAPSRFPTGAATIADRHQFNSSKTRSRFLTSAIPRAHELCTSALIMIHLRRPTYSTAQDA